MFRIQYDERVQDDITPLPQTLKTRIKKAIETKLTERPEFFGKPMRHSLLGFRTLRVGEYRVVYLIQEDQILVMLIAHRRHVYSLATRRLK